MDVSHKESISNFEELLIKSNSVSIHRRNLQLLLSEIHKTVNNLHPYFMAEVLDIKDMPYYLRGSNNLVLTRARTNLYGTDTVRFVGHKIWQTLPREIRVLIIGDF